MSWKPTNLPLNDSLVTASSYLNTLANDGIIVKHKWGKFNYYINTHLVEALERLD